ncbi:unnamed protein product [Camellia sinensis]
MIKFSLELSHNTMYRLKVYREMRARAPQTAFKWFASSRFVHSLPFATVNVEEISGSKPAEVQNLVQGKWTGSSKWNTILDPLNGASFIKVAEVEETGIQPFVESLSKCPKHGLHNPFKAPERYLMLGDVSVKAAHMLSLPKVSDFFCRLIQRVAPKSYQQAYGEVYVTQKFLENFGGDQVRFLARSFAVPGNHLGQQSHGFRWPYGPTAIITPFNFPLEIPVLQLMGALYMGNKPVLKVDSKVCIVMEQMLRLLHECGLPVEDVDFINADGKTMNKLLLEANPRMTLFTGSSRVADKLAVDLKGRIKLEDAGFDWKILGPDVQEVCMDNASFMVLKWKVDYVAWVCDQDAYACSGQKCSAQSILFMHENWSKSSLLSQMNDLASRRKLDDLTVGPVLTFTTEAMLEHVNKLLQIPGSKVLFGGEALKDHSIPSIYGAIKPTAVFVPIEEILKDSNYELVTREIFGPFQVVTEYKDHQLPMVLDALEKMHAHLTAAVVSNDVLFLQEVIGKSVNGTTYTGLRARTSGAPQNHWVESQALLAMEKAMDKKLSGKKLNLAKEALVLLMAAHDEFSNSELCLHYLLASSNLDEVILSSCISKLNGLEMMELIQCLGKWLTKYERFPQVGPCPKAPSMLGLKACEWVPTLEDIVKCLGLLVDEHFSSLVLHPEFHEELRSTEGLVINSLALEARLCCFMANLIETLRTEVRLIHKGQELKIIFYVSPPALIVDAADLMFRLTITWWLWKVTEEGESDSHEVFCIFWCWHYWQD